jgi:surface protein
MENSIFKKTIVFTTNQNPMKTNYTQIQTKEKTASSYASFFKSSVLKCSKPLLAFLFTVFFAGNLLAQSGDFVTKWNLATTGSGANQLSFTTTNNGTVNYSWTELSPGTSTGTGTLSISGTTATISGLPSGATISLRIQPTNFNRFALNTSADKSRLLDVEQWGTTAWTSMSAAFAGCANLNITATDIPNLSSVGDMSSMFQSCGKLNGPANIGSWNVSTITNMTSMFNGCTLFNQNIGNWNTANVTAMQNMFMKAGKFNQNIGGWNTAKLARTTGMFNEAYAFNQDISGWNTAAVTLMDNMFHHASSFNQNISGWNTAKVTSMNAMFRYATSFNQNLGNWTLNASVVMTQMLEGSGLNCNNYSATLIGWNSQSVTGRTLGATGRTYGAYAAAARTTLTGTKSWTITDGGQGTCNDLRLTITTPTGLYDYQGVKVAEDAVDRTWVVTPSATISNAAITFTWPTTPAEMTGFTRTDLAVYTRTTGVTGAGNWTLVSSGSATTSGTNHSYSVTGLSLSSGTTYYYGITNPMTPLPVSIIDFKGFVKNDIINLNWKVTDEKELSRYEIYSSTDGSNYSVCGSVSATVSEIGVKTYQFQDLSNKSALVYYKIKAINNDETGEWSSIVALHTTKPVVNKPLKVYPNPATDFINLEFEGIVPSYFNVLIMDMSGKVVYQLDGVESESNQYTLPLNGIESGMYIVKLSDEFGNTTINRFNIK